MLLSVRPLDFNPKFEVSACFCEYENKFLLLHRQDHKPQGNTWAITAGKVEKGESPIETIVREVQEEIGISIYPQHITFVDSVLVRYPEYDYIYHMHRASLEHNVIKLNLSEHKDFRWVTPQEALQYQLIEDEDSCIKIAYQL